MKNGIVWRVAVKMTVAYFTNTGYDVKDAIAEQTAFFYAASKAYVYSQPHTVVASAIQWHQSNGTDTVRA